MFITKQDLIRAAHACELAYITKKIMSVTTDTQVYYESGTSELFITFRGTQNIFDWIINLRMIKREYPYIKEHTDVRIHEGFLLSYDSVRKQIHDLIEAGLRLEDHLHLTIAGHSLGGAIAKICAFDIAESGIFQTKLDYANIRLITFGAPKVGNDTFVETFDRLPVEYYKVENVWDLVRLVPIFTFVLDDKSLIRFNKFKCAASHSINTYIEEIEKMEDVIHIER